MSRWLVFATQTTTTMTATWAFNLTVNPSSRPLRFAYADILCEYRHNDIIANKTRRAAILHMLASESISAWPVTPGRIEHSGKENQFLRLIRPTFCALCVFVVVAYRAYTLCICSIVDSILSPEPICLHQWSRRRLEYIEWSLCNVRAPGCRRLSESQDQTGRTEYAIVRSLCKHNTQPLTARPLIGQH